MNGWFVTGTDTGVGKTVIGGALAMLVRAAGLRVGAFKPVATGCRRDMRLGLVCEDAEFLAHCADAAEDLATINPVRYAGDLAPMVAAEWRKQPIDWNAIDQSWGRIQQSSDWVVTEGAGGLLVPIDRNNTMADLARRLDLPLVIVARPGLGTINHTLLTLEAARARKLTVAAVVVNGYRPGSATLAEETNPEVISRLAKMPIPLIVPFDARTDTRQGIVGESVLFPLRDFVNQAIGQQRKASRTP
ncbi:MAG TPA: dethiobiotin synthase [Phycisphaerae bacterium]|nr:dethiobiotin synthase [Phycisphaerae bacterium]HRY69609.1 dethiobiotin synthase [Phycisphaerae bacterium]HSA27276.1 dethiobiotin synthase [Phycisphaerae bacterium]